jgi:hypothetical protein
VREPGACRKSCSVVEPCRREFAVDLFENPDGYPAILAVVVETEILAATFAAKPEPDK